MIRTYRRINWRKIAVIGLTGISMLSVSIAFLEYRKWKACLSEVQALETQLNSYRHMVYVAAEKLPEGTVLTADKLNLELRYYDLQNMDFITEESFGKSVASDIEEGTCITTQMLSAERYYGREVFLAGIDSGEYVQAGDRIDVRIRYENAEDYTVLADKCIVQCDEGNGMILELMEEELLLISSAYTDQKRYDGIQLYVTKYPDHGNAAYGRVNYIPNREILRLLGREKTEGESRDALEERIMQKQ